MLKTIRPLVFAALTLLPLSAHAFDSQTPSFTPTISSTLGDGVQRQRWGVIVNGDMEERHRHNAELVFKFMQSYYRIPKEQIYVLSTRPVLGGIEAPGVVQNLVAVAAELRQRLTESNELVVYTTGHGGRDEFAGGYLALHDGPVTATDFARLFLANRAGKTVYFGDQCDSGSLAKAMTATDKRVLAISSVDDKHSTVCNFFIVPYLNAFDLPANDDEPKDGMVSEWEAFKSAKAQSLDSHRRMIDQMRSIHQTADETAEDMASGMYLLSPAWSAEGRGSGK